MLNDSAIAGCLVQRVAGGNGDADVAVRIRSDDAGRHDYGDGGKSCGCDAGGGPLALIFVLDGPGGSRFTGSAPDREGFQTCRFTEHEETENGVKWKKLSRPGRIRGIYL
jgi:hypothetical protein